MILERCDFDIFLTALKNQGYTLVGPTVRDEAIIYDDIQMASDLPVGWIDEQEAGRYRLKRREDEALFGYVVGPNSWKKYLYPPRTKLMEITRKVKGFEVYAGADDVPAYAFLGVRACEWQAIQIQDKVFMEGTHVDPHYKARRDKAFVIAVNCTQAASTCFCVSMKAGPKVGVGVDLALTEVVGAKQHYFVVEVGSTRGEAVMAAVPHQPVQEFHQVAAHTAIQQAVDQMGRVMETEDVKELLQRHLNHAHWDEVAKRCLSCANCTMVCPTCFCSTVEDVTDLSGDHAQRWRTWDSCFTMDFSYIHGGQVRSSGASRYRQWMTHKLSSWQDQFDTMGCVGCGRCISWCPVGIDITEEVQTFRQQEEEQGEMV